MRRLAIGLGVVLGVAMLVAAASAGGNPQCRAAIHIKAHPTSCTEGYPSFPSCVAINTTYWGTGDVDIMPVFYDLVAFTSVEFGIEFWNYPSTSIAWTRCQGDAAVGTITHSGDGTVITWNTCQTVYSVAPGYGWMTIVGPEFICPTYNPVTHHLGMVDCSPSPGPYFDYTMVAPCGGLGGTWGDDPCYADAVQPTTWGAIKALLK
jgi:hypothetical protein